MKIKQFVFLRKDLKSFSTGALVAQACHASIAAIEKYKEDVETITYLKDLEEMTTVVYSIEEGDIQIVCEDLEAMHVKYYLWIEEKKIRTCISTVPIDISSNRQFEEYRKKFRLYY
ncbi:peptidyl-tRNA hydrolase domain-containing protein 1 [Glugoides intestinalis]